MERDKASEFEQLIAQVQAGSEQAAYQLVSAYHRLVSRVVRRRLPGTLRRVFDSHDIVQVAWASVFRHRSRLDRFKTPEQFEAFLAAVAANKVALEMRRQFGQQKRNMNRDRPLDSAALVQGGQAATPSQVAMAREEFDQLLDKQPTRYREILRLRSEGYSSREIARRTGLHEGNVRRVIRRIVHGKKR